MTHENSVFLNLKSYLDFLARERQLVVVEAEVDPNQEVPEIHRRVISAEGPALLFANVKNSDFPLVTNLFGTQRRAEAAFGLHPQRLIQGLVDTVETLLPINTRKLWQSRHFLSPLLKLGTRRVRSGPVTEVVRRPPQLDRLPVLTCWPEDGGPFVTLPFVYTEHPDGKGSNLGIYRMQVFDSTTTGMHWQIGKGGGFHYQVAEERGEALPLTVFLGGPPSMIVAAAAPLPENVPEILLASFLIGRRLPVCKGPGHHPLIAQAEFAFIGKVPPSTRHPEGPFGDHYGYYSLEHDYPVFEVDQVLHRKDAIYPATVVGKPRQEDFYVGDFVQELLSPLFPLVMPGVRQLWSYGETGYHSLAAAVVQQRYSREAMVSAFRILGEGQLSLTKFLLLTDSSVDLRDFRKTLAHLLQRTNIETDLYVFSNLSMDTLDYTGPAVNRGSKGVWLGLGEPKRSLPQEFAEELPRGVSAVRVFCPGCLVVEGPRFETDPGAAAELAGLLCFRDWTLLVLTDNARKTAASSANFLWTTFTRFEPASDIHAGGKRIHGNHLALSPPILIDARMKPSYPQELFCVPETAQLVTRRWKEYFTEKVEMGDSDNAHLTP